MANLRSLLYVLFLLAPLLTLTSGYGDVLNRTFCLCGTDFDFDPGLPRKERMIYPDFNKREVPAGPSVGYRMDIPIPSRKGEGIPKERQATYFLFEYYNLYLDHVFVMEETCHSNHDTMKRDEIDREDCLDYMGERARHCKNFPLLPGEVSKHSHHEFCYHFFRSDRKKDTYKWDGQRRAISKFWYLISELGDVVRDVCEPICKEKFDLPMFEGGRWYWKSRKDMVYDQADMCDVCP